MPLKSRPILLDMTATCASADLQSPTHDAAAVLTALEYGVCEVMPAAEAEWRRTPAANRRPSYDDARSTTTEPPTVDYYADARSKWNAGADDNVEFDSRLCWAAYHHHVPACADTAAASGDQPSLNNTSSFRPSVRTPATLARTHVYEMPQFQS